MFVHDGPLYKNQEGNYYGVDYNTDLKNRYLYLGDSVTFLIRVKDISDTSKLSAIDGDNLQVLAVHDFKSVFKYFTSRKKADIEIEQAVKGHDIIIIRLPSSIGFIAYKYALKYKKPYLIELVACPWDGYFNHSLLGKLVAPYMYLKTKGIVKNAQYVVYVSERFLQNRYPTRGKALSCSDVVLPDINEDNLQCRLEKIDNMRKMDTLILGTAGAVNMRYKGQQYVIQALKLLKEEGYHFEYRLAGGGDNTYLKKLSEKLGVQDNVKFLGNIPHEKVFDFMRDIDIYIQPSYAESHGRVIIEAFSTACPAIGSSTGGIPELIDSSFVFKRKNVKDLTEKIKLIAGGNLKEIAAANHKKAADFKQSTLKRKIEIFYDEFLKYAGVNND